MHLGPIDRSSENTSLHLSALWPTVSSMPREKPSSHRSALLSFQFLGTATAGSLVMALVSAYGPQSAQLAVLGAFVSALGGLFLGYLGQEEQRELQRAEAIQSLSVPLSLARDPDLFQQYQRISRSLKALADKPDPILRRLALLKFASVAHQIDGLADGQIVFALTEEWRTVYEQLLRSPDLRHYRSLAWVQTPEYWQNEPGRQSMRVNFEAVRRGVLVERIIILNDGLWPLGQPLPAPSILPWIEEQHRHGLWIGLLRQSELGLESDLLLDMGLYGERALGVQELDEHCRTLRFTLDLDPQALRLAEARWQRLLLYAVPFRSLLEQPEAEE
jgi:hypothetical protein